MTSVCVRLYVVMNKILSSCSSSPFYDCCVRKLVLSLFLGSAAACWRCSSGYCLMRKCCVKFSTCMSKSSLLLQIQLTLKIWLYGILYLHLWGVPNCSIGSFVSQLVLNRGREYRPSIQFNQCIEECYLFC